MGEAKKRGTREQRVQSVVERKTAMRPDVLICNSCSTQITDITDLDARGLKGIDAAFAGICPKCGAVTHALQGDPAMVAQLAEVIEREHGESIIGMQSRRGERIA